MQLETFSAGEIVPHTQSSDTEYWYASDNVSLEESLRWITLSDFS